MKVLSRLALATLAFFSFAQHTFAQEVRYVDATLARTELRVPPANCTGVGCLGGSGGGMGGCSTHGTDPRALRISLVSLNFDSYKVGDRLAFEVKVQNSGTGPITLAASPHLADLQPNDTSEPFDYEELGLSIRFKSDVAMLPGPMLRLYAAASDPYTFITLAPGEWIRIRGEQKLQLPAGARASDESVLYRATADAWQDKVHLQLTPGHSMSHFQVVCSRTETGDALPVQLFLAAAAPAGQ